MPFGCYGPNRFASVMTTEEIERFADNVARRTMAEKAAKAGVLPDLPELPARAPATHRRRLAEIAKLVENDDLDGLEAWDYTGRIVGTMYAVLKYRRLAITAMKARREKAND
jgi:hypothetical protein